MGHLSDDELMKKALNDAINFAGNQSALARLADVSPQAVQQWVSAGRVSHKKARVVSDSTGVDRCKLRPDLYARAA